MTQTRKGIVLAGGKGSRLNPLTNAVSKQLMPVYSKPMIYYPITTLMLSGIRDILIICNPQDIYSFQKLLGDGKNWGISISYAIQKEPKGIAEAFILAENFLDNAPAALILGDNLFYGENLCELLQTANRDIASSTLFAYNVNNPERYGVIEFDENNNAKRIDEKPTNPSSNYAVTGLYFYDNSVVEISKQLTPSKRGELEITDLNNIYLSAKQLKVKVFNRGTVWFDTGTFESLHEAGSFIRAIETRQGLKIGSPEEVAWRKGWINDKELIHLASSLLSSSYGQYLSGLAA